MGMGRGVLLNEGWNGGMGGDGMGWPGWMAGGGWSLNGWPMVGNSTPRRPLLPVVSDGKTTLTGQGSQPPLLLLLLALLNWPPLFVAHRRTKGRQRESAEASSKKREGLAAELWWKVGGFHPNFGGWFGGKRPRRR